MMSLNVIRRCCDSTLTFGSSLWIRRASDERGRVPASITFVSVEKETSARGRLVVIARAVHRRSSLRVFAFLLWIFSLSVIVLLCVENPDLWDRKRPEILYVKNSGFWLAPPQAPCWRPQGRRQAKMRVVDFFRFGLIA